MNTSNLESEDEQLTAYLDGELSTEESMAIESRLVTEERLRLRLADLRKSYELLDELPETPHNQRFTQSTLELVVKDLTESAPKIGVSTATLKDKSVEKSWWLWPRLAWLIGGLFLLGTCSGLAARYAILSREFRQLGLAANFPGLSDVNELSIAESLSHEETAIEVLKRHYGEDLVPPTPLSFQERRDWVDQLTPIQIDRVHRGQEIIRKLRPETYKRLAAMESLIDSKTESQAIQDTIRLVGLVFDDLPSFKREDMDSLTQDKRAQYLREHLRYSAALAFVQQLSASDEKALDDWFSNHLTPSVQPMMGPRDQEIWWFLMRLYSEPNFALPNHDELLAVLFPKLSQTAAKLLEPLTKSDQTRVLSYWCTREGDSHQRFMDRYEKSPREFRERMDIVDPESVRRPWRPRP
jgi:hypothetical protein